MVRGTSPPPPPPPIIFEGRNVPQKLYINGKGIYQRVRFILDIDKIFCFCDFMSNFREMTPQWLQKNCKLLKCEHIINHFKVHDLEIPFI